MTTTTKIAKVKTGLTFNSDFSERVNLKTNAMKQKLNITTNALEEP